MKLSYEELFAQNQLLIQKLDIAIAEIKTLKKENEALKKEIKELQEKLNTNSSNSSKPPSQDPYRAPRKKKSTGKKQGAQADHKGHSRQLVPIDQVQMVYDLTPHICSDCQSSVQRQLPWQVSDNYDGRSRPL